MIEPHSAQLGASSWILNATFVAPSDSVTVPRPLPFVAFATTLPFAWPLEATTASSSRAEEEEPPELLAAEADEFASGAVAPPVFDSIDCPAAGSFTSTEVPATELPLG
jgi:hypothetical protein